MNRRMVSVISACSILVASGVAVTAAYASDIYKPSGSGNTLSVQQSTVSYPNGAKTGLQTKMINAIDNYRTLQGTYSEKFDPIGVSDTTTFAIQLAPTVASYAKSDFGGKVTEFKQDGENAVVVNPDGSQRSVKVSVHASKQNLQSLQSRYPTIDGKAGFVLRGNPAGASTDDVTFPQQFALGYLKNQSTWKIDGQTTFLGRQAVEISGQLPKDLQAKHDAVRFDVLIDDQTGILLREQEYNTAGQVTNQIVVTSLSVNQPIDSSLFSLH